MGTDVQPQVAEIVDLRRHAHYWKEPLARVRKRVVQLRRKTGDLMRENGELRGKLDRALCERDAFGAELINLKKRHFGRKTEPRKAAAPQVAVSRRARTGKVTGSATAGGSGAVMGTVGRRARI